MPPKKVPLVFLFIYTLALAASAGEMTVKGFDGRDVILNTDGRWKFAQPLDLIQSVGEFFVQILDVRGDAHVPPVIDPKTGLEKQRLVVTYFVARKQPPTQYDPPFESKAQIIDVQSGEPIADESRGYGYGRDNSKFVFPADLDEAIKTRQGNCIEARFMLPSNERKTIALRIICTKSYTPPPNEFIATFKEVPVFAPETRSSPVQIPPPPRPPRPRLW